MKRIDEMTRADIAEIQRTLTELGFGELKPDGIWGPATARAYDAYLASMPVSQAVTPPAAKPWYTSSALIGALISLLAWMASFAGYEFDVESAKQVIPELIGVVFAAMAVVGTWRRKAPIDPTLVLPGVRLPTAPRLRDDPALSSGLTRTTQSRVADVDHARGSFGDDA